MTTMAHLLLVVAAFFAGGGGDGIESTSFLSGFGGGGVGVGIIGVVNGFGLPMSNLSPQPLSSSSSSSQSLFLWGTSSSSRLVATTRRRHHHRSSSSSSPLASSSTSLAASTLQDSEDAVSAAFNSNNNGISSSSSSSSLGSIPTPYSQITVGVLKETYPGENRVSLAPDSVKMLVDAGMSVVVESGGEYRTCCSFDTMMFVLLLSIACITHTHIRILVRNAHIILLETHSIQQQFPTFIYSYTLPPPPPPQREKTPRSMMHPTPPWVPLSYPRRYKWHPNPTYSLKSVHPIIPNCPILPIRH